MSIRGPMYCFAVVGSAAGASKNHLGVFNGTGSGVVLRVWRVEVVPHLTAAITGTAATFLLSRTTTAGSGSPSVLRKFDLLAASLPAQITALHTYVAQPTVTLNSELAALTVNAEETAAQGGKAPLFEAVPDRRIEPVVVRENSGIVVPQAAFAGAGSFSVFVYFTADPS